MNKIIKIIVLIVALLGCVCLGAQMGRDNAREQQAEQTCAGLGASGYVIINGQVRCIYE